MAGAATKWVERCCSRRQGPLSHFCSRRELGAQGKQFQLRNIKIIKKHFKKKQQLRVQSEKLEPSLLSEREKWLPRRYGRSPHHTQEIKYCSPSASSSFCYPLPCFVCILKTQLSRRGATKLTWNDTAATVSCRSASWGTWGMNLDAWAWRFAVVLRQTCAGWAPPCCGWWPLARGNLS